MLRFVFFSLLLVYSCQIFESKEINEISDAQFSEIQDTDYILVDVRTLEEYESGHIQDAINFLTKGRTTIVIAHRLSTILNADKIYVIDKGLVVGEGKHKDLVITSNIYKNFYEKQIKK